MAAASGSAAGRMMRFMFVAFGRNFDISILRVVERLPCSYADIRCGDSMR